MMFDPATQTEHSGADTDATTLARAPHKRRRAGNTVSSNGRMPVAAEPMGAMACMHATASAPPQRAASGGLKTMKRLPRAATRTENEAVQGMDTAITQPRQRRAIDQPIASKVLPVAATTIEIGATICAETIALVPQRQQADAGAGTVLVLPVVATDGAGTMVQTKSMAPPRRRAKEVLISDRVAPVAVTNGASIALEAIYPPPQREAESWSATDPSMPLAPIHEIGGEDAVVTLQAGHATDAMVPLPEASIIEQGAVLNAAADTGSPLAQTVSALVELQKQRRFCIVSQSRCDRSVESFIARFLGFRVEADPKERKEVYARAAAMRRAVEKGGHVVVDAHTSAAPADGQGSGCGADQSGGALAVCTPIILISAASRQSWDTLRSNVEKQMRKLARTLPVWAWVEGVRGFGELGLAIIVGETGDLSTYATKERVWKRLGLAVIEGERQQRRSGAEEAAKHGYNPKRRAEIWTVGDSMFRAQWRGAKDDAPAHALGPYGAAYAARKAKTEGREGWSLKRRDSDARRIMTKTLLEDLWRVWNGKPALAGKYDA